MEARMREANQAQKFMTTQELESIVGKYLGFIKAKDGLQLKPTLICEILYINYVGNHTLTKERTLSTINMFLNLNNDIIW